LNDKSREAFNAHTFSQMEKHIVIRADGLAKRFQDLTAVNGLNLTIQAGQCFGLLGPNGAGKSTTLKMLLGISRPDSGDIRVLGHSVPQDAAAMRMKVGVVPQSDMLDPDFTVTENLTVYGRYFGLPNDYVQGRVPELLDFAGLANKADSKISELSGGMKRRLTLARALINDPQILFLDEPTTGLDPQARHLIWERLQQLVARGKTIVLTTHFMDEAQRLCDSLVVIEQGKVIASGSPAKLIQEHIEPHVLELRASTAAIAQLEQDLQPLVVTKSLRLERFGDTCYAYTADLAQLQQRLADKTGLTTLSRAANLEDVFLRLTGRDLRD
jgi:lipooligosaccharide transport system ATP-binding protein